MLDCLIVGAGFGGLTVATQLVRRGHDVMVLEARDRIGGRVDNARFSSGELVEQGGQWVFPNHDRMLELIDEAAAATMPANPGKLLVVQQGDVRAVEQSPDEHSHRTPFAAADLGQGVLRLRRLAERTVSDPAWAGANTAWLDQPMERWLTANLRTPSAQRDLRGALRAVVHGPLSDTTLGDVLTHVRAGVDMENLIATNGDIGQVRLVDGVLQLAERMAAQLEGRVRLSTPVVTIDQEDDAVVVVTSEGEQIRARTAVLSVPPWLAKDLVWAPQLDPWRYETVQKTPAGAIIKCHMLFEPPWWRDAGLSGQMAADDGPVRVTFDTSDPASERGILMGFFEGAEAATLTKFSASMRERVFRDALVTVFGEQAATPLEYLDHDWGADPFTKGSHGAHFAPGLWSVTGQQLGARFGRVHFAGAEYASKFNGYMEGAVRSGTDTAAQVVMHLHGQ
ncbi:flavin monoamine oxidase family protein [Propionibacterium freudenreichii]|uniref:flavin monoamine oxidase family protein n=1 Tax=Propionibacterium freudenreichii TaxID=1744 RepID=UPI0005CBCB33|nr:FAD-dependent oxidoreductase [Propionibacterium freudenreichii]MDK9302781.1 FAD-dependent oxidoreductase [Propionibacterium freudenreichii]MDK9340999.1 FAD-dependent oxidoreductase [Propionibacterium freudenreichii]MDK9664917.1 FAD-dependent oxidoreductase [Propionibacterium freudenreichii]MDK9670295.1 FAD-dependent oxidoreductase [Propionibacterium freudenreichii]